MSVDFKTLTLRTDGAVLFAGIAAPPMNLLGPELVRDLVCLIQQAEADSASKVLVFKSGDPDYFISDRKSTRLNSSHQIISYAVFCLKKKKKNHK